MKQKFIEALAVAAAVCFLVYTAIIAREVGITCSEIKIVDDAPYNHVLCYNYMSNGELKAYHYGCLWGRIINQDDYTISCKRATNRILFHQLP